MPNGSCPPLPAEPGPLGWSLVALVACILAQPATLPPDPAAADPELAARIAQVRQQLDRAAPALAADRPVHLAQWRNV